jgi:hypothetical protein
MMAETVVGWLLLDAAVIAEAATATLAEDHRDKAFYAGKRHAAQYFARNVLPSVVHKAALLGRTDRSPVEISDDAFATV